VIGLNIGSGQRRFDPTHGWINVDVISRPPDQVPDLICDVGKEPLPYADGTVDVVVLHHVYEHFHLAEGDGVIREAHRVLKPGGSLIVTVPDLKALAEAWLRGKISEYIYCVNLYGAYQGEPGDDHHWGYTLPSLASALVAAAQWSRVKPYEWEPLPGASICKDWWITGIRCIR